MRYSQQTQIEVRDFDDCRDGFLVRRATCNQLYTCFLYVGICSNPAWVVLMRIRSFVVLLVLAASTVLAVGMIYNVSAATSQYQPHGPILIVENGGFTSANGVTGGSGTIPDPYVISGWNITSSTSNGVEIRNTTANFVARNLSIKVQGAARETDMRLASAWA